METMKPYSKHLRARTVKAVQEGISKSAAARLFGVYPPSSATRGWPTVERRSRQGRAVADCPKADETTTKLLEEDVKERPAATGKERRHFSEAATAKALSDSIVGRLLKRRGFSQKRSMGALTWDEFRRAAWRVMDYWLI